jgi:TolB-like protein/class 3 adenylate cyclase
MATQDFKGKLTAILSADVKDYSRLMREDEEATVRTITTYREVIGSVVQKHRGEVVDSPGDNILAEFASVVDAVRSAVEVQEELKARNAELPEGRRMEFRIGINLGDVIHEKERIYGDGVNVAARVESLADAGGICVSRSAYDQVKDKLTLGYEYLGEHSVKNIAEPVRVYRVLMEPEAAGKVIGEKRVEPKRGQIVTIAVVIAFLLVAGGLVLSKSSLRTAPSKVPGKPSIAVLPFDNMSEDSKQEYFADGMSDDLITDLSKISGLLVVARNSTFTYKGKAVKIPQIAQELGVRYVLEGSVRRAGDEVRINAQLIDSTTGGHLWAERYDGRMDDIFALQDKITGQIVNALAVKLTTDEEKRFELKETSNIEAYDSFLKGWQHYLHRTPKDFAEALPYFKKAVELDPNYGRAYAALALTYWRGAGVGWAKKMGMSYSAARVRARHYLELAMKNPTPTAHRVASDMAFNRQHKQKAFAEAKQAIVLDPNNSENHRMMAKVMIAIGKPEKSIASNKRAMLLNPFDKAFPLGGIGFAHFCMGQYKEAVSLCEKALENNPKATSIAAILAAAYGQLGREPEARAALDRYLKGWGRKPGLPAIMYFWPLPIEQADHFAEGLLKAGLKGKPGGYYKITEKLMLSGEEIRSLFFGKKTTGFWGKHQWEINRTNDGETTYLWDSKVIGIGKSWVEGNLLCNQFKKLFGGLSYCMDVYRNPEGTSEEKNEYVTIDDKGIFGCSLEG